MKDLPSLDDLLPLVGTTVTISNPTLGISIKGTLEYGEITGLSLVGKEINFFQIESLLRSAMITSIQVIDKENVIFWTLKQ